jgi:hypothetical protein
MPDLQGLKYGGGSYLAYGYVGGTVTVFKDLWAGRVSALIHEVGHNMMLNHAGLGNEEYGDMTGYMGKLTCLERPRSDPILMGPDPLLLFL